MRHLFAVPALVLAATFLAAADDGAVKVEVKGPHICCKQCVNVVAKLLGKVDGVSEVKSDIKTKTVTFTAKNQDAVKAGFKALLDGGFSGAAKADGKDVAANLPAGKKDKANTITVKGVHVCCGQCKSAIEKAFEKSEAKVSFEGDGPQKSVKVESTGTLEKAAVLDTLRKAGFNGAIAD